MDETRGFNILRVTEDGEQAIEDVVAKEFPLITSPLEMVSLTELDLLLMEYCARYKRY